MARFQILPTDEKFFDWFNKSANNVLEGARLLHQLLSDYSNVGSRVAQIKEIEHHGDFIVHETLDLLRSTFITPARRSWVSASPVGWALSAGPSLAR
jgi:uncharacterized protein Yka (UPF0111/DUF47 family)